MPYASLTFVSKFDPTSSSFRVWNSSPGLHQTVHPNRSLLGQGQARRAHACSAVCWVSDRGSASPLQLAFGGCVLHRCVITCQYLSIERCFLMTMEAVEYGMLSGLLHLQYGSCWYDLHTSWPLGTDITALMEENLEVIMLLSLAHNAHPKKRPVSLPQLAYSDERDDAAYFRRLTIWVEEVGLSCHWHRPG